MKRKYGKILYPLTYKEIDAFLISKNSTYRTNKKFSKEIINDKNSDIYLICTIHDNYEFKSKLRYLTTDSNGDTGQCKVCNSLSVGSRSITRFELEKIFKNHSKHPALLIDDRFKKYDIVNKNLALKIKCLYCDYDEQKVSYLNFVAKDTYEHKCFKCLGCSKNEKISCDLVDKKIFVFLQEIGYEIEINSFINKKRYQKGIYLR